MNDITISVKNLTKTYRIFGHPGDRIKQALTFGKMRFHREFTALQDVSFEIKKGESVGIIGRNGSSKSTLRQLILKPTSVTVEARHEYGVELQVWDYLPQANAIVLALNTLRRSKSSAAASLNRQIPCTLTPKY